METHLTRRHHPDESSAGGSTLSATACGKASGIALLAVALLLLTTTLCACAAPGPSGRDAAEGSASAALSADPADAVVQRAMVAYANGDDVLLVDQETQAPYIPTLPDGGVYGMDGQLIDGAQLAAGNIVEVTGNGIMLESYPGQYPGISRIQVIEQGSPGDAEQYAPIVGMVFSASAAEGIPSAVVEYRTELGQVSINVDPFAYALSGAEGEPSLDGSFAAEDGSLMDGMIDAVIDGEVDASATFSMVLEQAKVKRVPLAKSGVSEGGAAKLAQARIDPAAAPKEVSSFLADGVLTFPMEPNYAYVIEAEFADGQASYAFVAVP